MILLNFGSWLQGFAQPQEHLWGQELMLEDKVIIIHRMVELKSGVCVGQSSLFHKLYWRNSRDVTLSLGKGYLKQISLACMGIILPWAQCILTQKISWTLPANLHEPTWICGCYCSTYKVVSLFFSKEKRGALVSQMSFWVLCMIKTTLALV